MKKFTIPCYAGGKQSSITVFIGNSDPQHNPIHFQAEFLAKERGITIPAEIMESLEKLKNISQSNGVPFVQLCEYAFKALADIPSNNPSENKASVDTQVLTKEESK